MRKTGINTIQNFTQFYCILSNFTNFMDLRHFVMNDKATYMWLSGQV
jgi:hypothetical protein